MSQRGNGLMAHVGKPGNIDDAIDALGKVMLKEDPASPIATPVPARETPASPQVVVQNTPLAGVLGETARKKRKRVLVTLNSRVDDWVHDALEKVIEQLNTQGYTVTKQDIVVQSIIRGLNLTPPEGWSLR